MKYLKIKNNGVLDIRLVALMGGTTKANDEFKIGQFGTGLKYTLAFLVRNNIDFHIFAGTEKVELRTEQETIKDDTYNIICINGHRTSITDRMGYDWQAWMILRELWCNALDEGGQHMEITQELTADDGCTCFYIQVTSEIKEVIDNWGKYFIHNVEPLHAGPVYSVYPGGESLRIYKQGVLIHEIKEVKALYSYDVKNASINELREFKGNAAHVIFKSLQHASPSVIRHFLETVSDQHYEGGHTDYNWYENFGEEWRTAIGAGKIIHQEALTQMEARGIEMDASEFIVVPKNIYKVLTKQFDGIGALRISNKVNEFYETYNPAADQKIKEALVILESAGYDFSPEIKFVYGVFGAKDIKAQVNMDTKEVLISENILQSSLFEVVYILIEENEHLKTGFQDCSRSFQTHFLRLYAQQLLKTAKIEL